MKRFTYRVIDWEQAIAIRGEIRADDLEDARKELASICVEHSIFGRVALTEWQRRPSRMLAMIRRCAVAWPLAAFLAALAFLIWAVNYSIAH